MADPTDYEYDVFISYRRISIIEQWLDEKEFFSDLLVSYLELELERALYLVRE